MNPETKEVSKLLKKDAKARGTLAALDQVIDQFRGQTDALKERSTHNEGGRRACVVIEKGIDDLAKLLINTAEKGTSQRGPEELKLVIEGVRRAGKLVHDIGQDFMQESLMLKGEARAMQSQIEEISKRRTMILGKVRRDAEAAAEDAAQRRQRRSKAEAKAGAKAEAKGNGADA